VGFALLEDEGAVGKGVERSLVVELAPSVGSDALGVELRVDCGGADLAGMQPAPDRDEVKVVAATAQCAGAMSRGERRSPRRERRAR
jgi:hypothetical protein